MHKTKLNALPGNRTKKSKICGEQMKKWSGKLVYVNEMGTHTEDEDGDPVAITTDAYGNKIGTTVWNNVFQIDEAVAVTWKDRPYDGHGYYVTHIDGNKGNCAANNLKWEPVSGTTTADSVFIDDTIVHRDGTIIVGETTANFEDGWHDDDLELRVAFRLPKAVIYYDDAYPDFIDCYELYEKAGYIQGDKSLLKEPVVIHIDGDRHNHHSENLKWVEKDDPSYMQFDAKNDYTRKNLNLQFNPGRERDLNRLNLI